MTHGCRVAGSRVRPVPVQFDQPGQDHPARLEHLVDSGREVLLDRGDLTVLDHHVPVAPRRVRRDDRAASANAAVGAASATRSSAERTG